jgi:hypothetical protein
LGLGREMKRQRNSGSYKLIYRVILSRRLMRKIQGNLLP